MDRPRPDNNIRLGCRLHLTQKQRTPECSEADWPASSTEPPTPKREQHSVATMAAAGFARLLGEFMTTQPNAISETLGTSAGHGAIRAASSQSDSAAKPPTSTSHATGKQTGKSKRVTSQHGSPSKNSRPLPPGVLHADQMAEHLRAHLMQRLPDANVDDREQSIRETVKLIRRLIAQL